MVVDRSTQNLYQALLRHLLGLAMVERELHIIWRTYQSTRALFRCALLSHPVCYLPMSVVLLDGLVGILVTWSVQLRDEPLLSCKKTHLWCQPSL